MATDESALAMALSDASDGAEPIDPGSVPDGLSVAEAYKIQDAVVDARSNTDGPIAGYKIGFTNEAVQTEFGVDTPIYGRLLRDTIRSDGVVNAAELIDPLLEPELAFVLDESLSPPVNRLDVLCATRYVVPAVEVVDSRIEGWEFGAAGAVADNALAARLIVGDPVPVDGIDLALEGVEISIDGQSRDTGVGAAALGHPADAVVWLAETLGSHGSRLDAGDVVTTGTVTTPRPISAGETAVVRYSSMGSIVVHAR